FAGHLEGASGSFSGDIYGSIIQGSQFISQSDYDDLGHYESIVLNDKHLRVIKIGRDTVVYGIAEYHSTGIYYQGSYIFPEFEIDADVFITGNLRVLDFLHPLWTGQMRMTDTQTVTPSKRLSQCTTGWILRWQRHIQGQGAANSHYGYTHISKNHIDNEGASVAIPLAYSAS